MGTGPLDVRLLADLNLAYGASWERKHFNGGRTDCGMFYVPSPRSPRYGTALSAFFDSGTVHDLYDRHGRVRRFVNGWLQARNFARISSQWARVRLACSPVPRERIHQAALAVPRVLTAARPA